MTHNDVHLLINFLLIVIYVGDYGGEQSAGYTAFHVLLGISTCFWRVGHLVTFGVLSF